MGQKSGPTQPCPWINPAHMWVSMWEHVNYTVLFWDEDRAKAGLYIDWRPVCCARRRRVSLRSSSGEVPPRATDQAWLLQWRFCKWRRVVRVWEGPASVEMMLRGELLMRWNWSKPSCSSSSSSSSNLRLVCRLDAGVYEWTGHVIGVQNSTIRHHCMGAAFDTTVHSSVRYRVTSYQYWPPFDIKVRCHIPRCAKKPILFGLL